MPRGPSKKLKPFQKIAVVLLSGKEVSVEEIDTLLGEEIHMYRLSTYMWLLKVKSNATIKSVRDGQRVVGYQLVNIPEVKKYLDGTGLDYKNFTPGGSSKKQSNAKANERYMKSVKKLSDLNAEQVVTQEVEPAVEA
jgi:hypothetical protein